MSVGRYGGGETAADDPTVMRVPVDAAPGGSENSSIDEVAVRVELGDRLVRL